MKTRHWLLLGLLWGAPAAAGNDIPAVTLADVIEAHGGGDALRAIEGYAAHLEVTERWVRQSPTPGPPWTASGGLRCHSLDLSRQRYADYERGMAPGSYPAHWARWLSAGAEPGTHAGWHFNLHDGRREPASAGDFGDRYHRTMQLAPALLVRAMAAEPGRVTALGEQPSSDAPRSRFYFEPRDGEGMRLGFDSRTRMLRELSVGDTAVSFDGFEIVDGFPVSRRMTLERHGDIVRRIHLKRAAFDPAFPSVPDSLRALPAPGAGSTEEARRFKIRTLAPGVHLIGEDHRYQLFVEFRDFVVGLGGVGGVEKRLNALRAVTGAKPLRYALITHHHPEHLAGVPALVDAGAVLVISPAHEPVVRTAAGNDRTPRFAHVTERREITDGERRLVFLDLGDNRHSEHLLAAWLPAEKFLFTADLLGEPPGRPASASGPLLEDFQQALQRLELNATRYVNPHSPAVTNLAELKVAANKAGRMTEFAEVAEAVCPR